MSKNSNRDYLLIVDVKTSTIREFNKLEFYINDKESHNIFVQLVIKESHDIINKYVPVDDPNLYELTMNIVKPTNEHKKIIGKLISLEDGLYEFRLPQDCCDKVGTYKCELETKYNSRITNSNNIKYRIKKSVLNDLDGIVDAPGYPIVIQLLDKLSDIDQYEEDRRSNELARQLAEKQRQARFNALDADMVDRITAMDDKMVDVENRVSTKEQAVDKLIADTKADIDNYKVAKDQEINDYKNTKDREIDDYKNTKDTEINQTITRQDNKISEAITNQNKTISDAIADQDNKIDTAIEEQNNRITTVESNDTVQNNRLDELEAKDIAHESRIANAEAKNVEQDNRLDSIEAVNISQGTRLDSIEIKNRQQDDRLLDVEKVNKRQDMDLKCLFAESKNNMMDVTEEGNSIYLQNSTVGYTLIDEVQGNTLVNCNKEADKELILNGNINTQGYSNITLTEGVNGGLVDVALEGNTMVNVCDQKDPVAITKSYTVEAGNHVALQGEYDGKCRPVVTGNTLVNLVAGDTYVNDRTWKWETKLNCIKEDTTYTILFELYNIVNNKDDIQLGISIENLASLSLIDIPFTEGFKTVTVTTRNSSSGIPLDINSTVNFCAWIPIAHGTTTYSIKNLVVLEGDYTDKPIPDYFEGLQSSFEDNLVTQEMVDNGEELAENLGKYKVDYVVTGKNKFSSSFTECWINASNGNVVNATGKIGTVDMIKVRPNTLYGFSRGGIGFRTIIAEYDKNKLFIKYSGNEILTTTNNTYYLRIFIDGISKHSIPMLVENGTNSETYEPYKEYKKTFYLNSPLLEGDTIEQQGNNVVHVHRSEIRAYEADDELTLPTDMTNTLVAKARPTYEVISQNDTILCDSYINGHLDVDSVVPIEKVDFNNWNKELMYLYPNTEYTVQFESDNSGILYNLNIAGVNAEYLSIVKGINKFNITTGSNLPHKVLVTNGIGFNASNIVVTQATDQDFGYFEGMKSVGECEELEIKSGNKNLFDINLLKPVKGSLYGHYEFNPKGKNMTLSVTDKDTSVDISELYIGFTGNGKNTSSGYEWLVYNEEVHPQMCHTSNMKYISFYPNTQTTLDKLFTRFNFQLEEGSTATDYIPHQSNTQQLTHEPLRAVGDIKDKYVLIDGKWYIERNCKEAILDGSDDEGWSYLSVKGDDLNTWVLYCSINYFGYTNYNYYPLRSDKLRTIAPKYDYNKEMIYGNNYSNGKIWIHLFSESFGATKSTSVNDALVLFKQYLSKNPITVVGQLMTPQYEPIDYNPLEVYSDTTHITTNSTIPTNITVKNTGFNCLLKPSTTYTISSNLGLNTVTTPSVLTEDCLRFMDTDTSDVTTMKDVLVLEGDWTTKPDLIPANFSGIESAFEQELVTDENDEHYGKYKVTAKVANEDKTEENNITFYINEPLRGVGDIKDRIYIKDDKVVVERNCAEFIINDTNPYAISTNNSQYPSVLRLFLHLNYIPNIKTGIFLCDSLPYYIILNKDKPGIAYINGFDIHLPLSTNSTIDEAREYLRANPLKVVYQLAEPVYEEIEYNDTKLFIESFKNSTLFYNSNVPITSKLYYSYSVPLVDAVAQTASIADEQDSMIIDLATQCAVMEMMLM